MSTSKRASRRQRGNVEILPNGSLRVRVYAGVDPVTKRPHYLRETIPAGPDAERDAQRVLTRLLNQLDERRAPKTNATVEQLLKRYLDEHFDGEPSTKNNYRRYARLHVLPFIGHLKVGQLDADALDSLYAELRRCRDHCTGRRRTIDHRTSKKHECDDRCGPHKCNPLGATTIRHIHFMLSGAYKRAVRWKWVSVSPVSQAEPPAAPPARPTPPTAAEAAKLLNEAWQRDEDWGAFVWLAMTTGARRGELCALCWKHLDLDTGVVQVKQAVAYDDENKLWYVKDTKTHQQRRIALDEESVQVLRDLRARQDMVAGDFDVELGPSSYVFSPDPDGRDFLNPATVTQRYDRMATRLGLGTSLHKLRHYSATELISAGVDPRTVAGRLGHGGGGSTTLKVYSAWVSEADQRASTALFSRLPDRPTAALSSTERAKTDPQSPYEHIAHDLRTRIADGEFPPGTTIPTVKKLMAEHSVAAGTANRAVALLKEWGLVESARGQPTVVASDASERFQKELGISTAPAPPTPTSVPAIAETMSGILHFEVKRLGDVIRTFTAEADLHDAGILRKLLLASIRRDGGNVNDILDYELEITTSDGQAVTTFIATGP